MLLYQNLHLLYTEKYKQSHAKIMNLKFQLQRGIMNFKISYSDIQDYFEHI